MTQDTGSQTWRVRRASAGDGADIAAIHNHYIRHTIVTFTTDERTADQVETLIRQGQPHWVVDLAGQVAGFATYFSFRKGPGYAHTMEHTVLLDTERDVRGAGRALMTALMADAATTGVHSLFAGVSAENENGVVFHAKLGFSQVARLPQVGWKFGRWHDLVLMQKFLSASETEV